MSFMTIVRHPVTRNVAWMALGALGLVGAQNSSDKLKQATLAQPGLSKADMVEIIQAVRDLPPAPLVVNNTIRPAK